MNYAVPVIPWMNWVRPLAGGCNIYGATGHVWNEHGAPCLQCPITPVNVWTKVNPMAVLIHGYLYIYHTWFVP